MSSVIPSAKYSSSPSLLKFSNGKTAIDLLFIDSLFGRIFCPNLPKNLSLRDGQETCIDISYKSDSFPSDADVKLLIVDPFDS